MNVPKLRFPEFRDDWIVKTLGELGKLSGGGTPDRSVTEYWQGNIPWVSSSDIYEDDIKTISVTRFINEKSISESATKIVPKGSVLFVSRVGTGKLAITDIDVCTSQDFMNFIPKKVSNYFLGYFFIANKSALISLGQGTSIKGFSKGDLEKFEVSVPSPLEQQKIADCLSSIDDLITVQTQKLNALKTHKKGLMRQLFPAEGETLPKLRFPEFQDEGEWKLMPLLKICNINPSGNDLPNRFIYIDLESVVSGNLKLKKEIGKDNAPSRAQRILKDGDVIYQTVRPYQMNNLLCDFADENIYVASTGYAQLRPLYSSQFLYQLIHTDAFVYKVLSKCTGSSYPAINSTDLAEISITIPKLLEQNKIADCLSSIDELIAAQTQKLVSLKTHKKGLMQQLFPVLDEIKR
jgi:type I restriction enzyme, S subunit